jgi:hypothetical protein
MQPSDDELRSLQSEIGLPYPPTPQTWHWRLAPSGDGGSAREWADKPHRLLYDACAEVERLNAGYLERGAEIERLRELAIPFIAIHGERWSRDHGLPDGHMAAQFYDMLAELGARVDGFTRATLDDTP